MFIFPNPVFNRGLRERSLFMAWINENDNRERNNLISFYLSDKELDLLNSRMKKYKNNNRSDFIRESILENFIIINDDKNLRSLVYEINRIGNNINQLTRLANETKEIQAVEEMQTDIIEVKRKIYHSLKQHNKKR